jgi:predicted transcriptional regulator
MKSKEYLDKAKVKLGIQSDYALAKALRVSQPAVINYRKGRSVMEDDVALKLARILELNPMEVIATANLERAKSDEMRAVWSEILEKISKGFEILLSGASPHGA